MLVPLAILAALAGAGALQARQTLDVPSGTPGSKRKRGPQTPQERVLALGVVGAYATAGWFGGTVAGGAAGLGLGAAVGGTVGGLAGPVGAGIGGASGAVIAAGWTATGGAVVGAAKGAFDGYKAAFGG